MHGSNLWLKEKKRPREKFASTRQVWKSARCFPVHWLQSRGNSRTQSWCSRWRTRTFSGRDSWPNAFFRSVRSSRVILTMDLRISSRFTWNFHVPHPAVSFYTPYLLGIRNFLCDFSWPIQNDRFTFVLGSEVINVLSRRRGDNMASNFVSRIQSKLNSCCWRWFILFFFFCNTRKTFVIAIRLDLLSFFFT